MTNEQLVIRIKAGIDTADNMLLLWQQNKRFVYKIVNQYKAYEEAEDLAQEGYLGLSTAVDHYNPDEGVSFIYYASYWIKQYIIRYIKSSGVVRIPSFMQERLREYRNMIDKWQQNYHRTPTDSEICHFLGISREMLEGLRKASQMTQIGSLDVPVGEEGECSMYDFLPSAMDEEEEAIERIQKEQLCAVIWPLVDSLPNSYPHVIRARYQEKRTLADIAKEEGVTLDAIRQREQKALRELRKPSKRRVLRPFLEDELYSRALQGNGVETFQRTWTSSTERAAIREAVYQEELEKLRAGV